MLVVFWRATFFLRGLVSLGWRGHQHTSAVWVRQRDEARADGQPGALDARQGNMARVVWRRPVEDGKGPTGIIRCCCRCRRHHRDGWNCGVSAEPSAAPRESRCSRQYGLHVGRGIDVATTMMGGSQLKEDARS